MKTRWVCLAKRSLPKSNILLAKPILAEMKAQKSKQNGKSLDGETNIHYNMLEYLPGKLSHST